MDVRKWNWPGYLTFSRGVSPKLALQDQRADAKNGSEEKPEGATVDTVVDGPDFPGPEAGLPSEVDRESLHEAMSTDGLEMLQTMPPSEEEHGSAVDSTLQTGEISTDPDVAPPTAGDRDSLQDEQDPSSSSSPSSPSTPVVRLTSPPSLSSSQSTIPVPVPAPSFRSFSLHFASQDDPLATAPRRVLYITVSEHSYTAPPLLNLSQKEQLTFAFLEPTPTISDDDNATSYQTSCALLANVQGLIDHDEANNNETPITAAKILQPKDKYIIVKGNDTTITSAEFASHSEHLFDGSQMIA